MNDSSTEFQKTAPIRKLRRLGKIGRVLSILAIFFLMVLPLFPNLFVGFIEAVAKESFDSAPTIAAPTRVSFDSWKVFASSVLPYAQLAYSIFGFVLIFRMFNRFAHGEILSRKVANTVKWIGAWLITVCIGVYYHYELTVTDVNIGTGVTTSTATEELLFCHQPLILIVGLIVLSLGFALAYGADVKEENILTI